MIGRRPPLIISWASSVPIGQSPGGELEEASRVDFDQFRTEIEPVS